MRLIIVGSDVTDQLLIRFFCIRQILEKEWEYYETVHQLCLDFKKVEGNSSLIKTKVGLLKYV
jgi:hypothetical protein